VGDNPEKLDGPGPRPLEVIAKEHGGDAALSGSSSDNVGDDKKKLSGDKADGLEREDSGTGELYVKSSGLKADGGDFDAAAPGAGREADRKHHHNHPSPSLRAVVHRRGVACHAVLLNLVIS